MSIILWILIFMIKKERGVKMLENQSISRIKTDMKKPMNRKLLFGIGGFAVFVIVMLFLFVTPKSAYIGEWESVEYIYEGEQFPCNKYSLTIRESSRWNGYIGGSFRSGDYEKKGNKLILEGFDSQYEKWNDTFESQGLGTFVETSCKINSKGQLVLTSDAFDNVYIFEKIEDY